METLEKGGLILKNTCPYKGQQLFDVHAGIRSMPSAIFTLHPPIILRGRWVTWLSAFSSTRSPARRAKMILMDAIYMAAKTVDRYLYDVDTPAAVTIFAGLR